MFGDDKECVIIDAPHDCRTIVKAIALQRRVTAAIYTHAHNDHINAVGEVCDGTRAPAYRPYPPVRRPIHGRIIEQCVAAAGPAPDAAGETTAPSVFFTIGCPGAGKTSVLRGLVDRYRTSNSGPTVPGPPRGLRRVLRILSGWLRNVR